MDSILGPVRFAVKERIYKHLRRCREAGTRIRYLIIVNLLHGRSVAETAATLGVHSTAVYKVAKRFREHGEWGLLDRREDNGTLKLGEHYLATLDEVVRGSPQDYGWPRPTWTRELLVETLAQKTGVRIHVATMSRALRLVRARGGRPRPTVACPWSKYRKTRRLKALERLLAGLPAREVAYYEDEVDIHLNPKIGLDWMGYAQQKEVLTPGQNVK